jgi:ATP-dependent helicase/nuclease subunit A
MDHGGEKRLSSPKNQNCPGSAAVPAASGGQDARAPVLVPDLTAEQRRAITARDVSVALSAGAGCGKTFVLTERFLFQLQPQVWGAAGPARLGQLVAITFTERAAREMRDRIRIACGQRLLACSDEQVDYWRELMRQLDTARISTIHSFCASLLRAHAVEARLDPLFRVLDQAQAETLLFELLDEHLHDRLSQRDEAVIELLVQFHNPEKLHSMISALLNQRQAIDWPQWRHESADGLLARWVRYWRSDFLPAVLSKLSTSAPAQTLLEIARKPAALPPMMRQRCEILLERLTKLPQSPDPQADLAAIREAAKVQGGGGKKAWPGEEIYEQFSKAAKKLRDDIDRYQARIVFDAEAARPAAETALRLLAVADGVAEAYESRKRQLAVLDFNDLLIRAQQLLTGADHDGLRRRLAAQLRLLLVDEFQDTDPLQVELVEALCDAELTRGKLFFVGDYKQSIYRFRGAQPQIFRRLREKMPAEGRLPLSLNFRSQPAVLDFVNALFCEDLAGEYEPLRPHREQVGPIPAVEWLWAADPAADASPGAAAADDAAEDGQNGPPSRDAADDEMGPAERRRRREADWLARRIRGLLDSGAKIVWDEESAKAGRSATRAVRRGDVAVLFRALSNVELYEEALRRYGIDYYLVGGHAFYNQQEIFDLLNLLRAVCNPSDEVSLLGVLRSPWFGLLDETLFWLGRHPEGLSAGLFAETLPAELSDPQRRRAGFAAATLRELRAIKDRLPIALWLNEALARTGYDAVLLAEFLGERKLANLRKLIEQARSFDRSGIFTLADFVTQLSEFVARQPDEALAATQPEQSDVVRLMTIHQSKGLEFPVVIVPDVDRASRGPMTQVAFTPQLGPMVKDRDHCSGFDLHLRAEQEEEHAELLRLLYVATTRAADYLILSSGVRQLGAARGPWTQLLNRRFDPLSGRLRATLPDGYRVPEIAVTTSEPPLRSAPAERTARQNLQKLVAEAQQKAAAGSGRVPALLAPIPPDPAARRQLSFSRLSGKLHAPLPSPVPESSAADGDAEPALDPRGLGTLVHAVLAEIDFVAPGELAELVRRYALRHLAAADGALEEPLEMIRRFLASPRAKELAAAQQLHAELEFLLAWPPDPGDCPSFRPDHASHGARNGTVPLWKSGHERSGGRYLQGFIDCLYQDRSGHWRLLDYKTNRVAPDGIEALAAQYEMQMLVYALATERILKQPPEELVLCFLRPGWEYHFPWNDTARRRAVELVDRAIASLAGGEK